MDIHLLETMIMLLSIACAIALLTRHLKQPYTIALVFVGLAIAFLKVFPEIKLTQKAVFTFILPPLLFQGAMHMPFKDLKKNWESILLLAIPGVVLSTFCIGYIMHLALGWDLFVAMLFGALITPTDPISVLAILREVNAPKRLRVMLEGESLFNDGTGVVVFLVLLGLVTGGHEFALGDTITQFLIVSGGGTVIGLIVGFLASHLLAKLDDHLIEVTITIILVYGTPILAEAVHASGIIALVVVGIILGNFGKIEGITDDARRTIEHFWEVIDFVVNSFLFLLIGIELQVINKGSFNLYLKPIIVGIIAILIVRAVVVYLTVWLQNQTPITEDINPKWSHVLFWGGLKGSIPLALVVGLPQDFAHREIFLTVAFSCVLFSLIVQGLTIKPLIKALKI